MTGICEYFRLGQENTASEDPITRVVELNRAITGSTIARDWARTRQLIHELAVVIPELEKSREPTAIKHVVDALGDAAASYKATQFPETLALREAAHATLVKIGRDAIPWLREGLSHSDPDIRHHCGLALQNIEESRKRSQASERMKVGERPEAERRLWSGLYFATAACALGIYLFGVLSYGSNPHSRYIEIREIGATSFECSFVPALISAFGLFLHLKRPRFKVTKMLFGWIVAFLFLVAEYCFISQNKQFHPYPWALLAFIFQSFSATIATSFLLIRSPNGSRAAEFVHTKSPRNGKTN